MALQPEDLYGWRPTLYFDIKGAHYNLMNSKQLLFLGDYTKKTLVYLVHNGIWMSGVWQWECQDTEFSRQIVRNYIQSYCSGVLEANLILQKFKDHGKLL